MTFSRLGGSELLALALDIVVAYVLALPVGWERKRKSEAYVGLRVFPLISVGACVYVFLGQQLFTGGDSNEQADVMQGLMTGIGFVGAGAILKGEDETQGVATAAAIWGTGAIGGAVAYGMYMLGLAITLMYIFILLANQWLFGRVQRAREQLQE